MATPKSDLQRKHTDPNFWKYFAAYLLMGSGFLLFLMEMVGYFFGSEEGISGVGLIAYFMGSLFLSNIQNRQLRERIDELEKRIDGSSKEADEESSV